MLSFDHCRYRISKDFFLQLNWQVNQGESWAVVGANGAGKSALVSVLQSDGELIEGRPTNRFSRVAVVSLEAQEALIAIEKRLDDSDLTDQINTGTPVREIIAANAVKPFDHWVDQLGIAHLMDRGFRKLSTGETRRVMIIRALASDPELLLLDEPFEGLDAATVPLVADLLAAAAETTTVVMAVNRLSEFPEWASHVLWLEQGRTAQTWKNVDAADTTRLIQQINSIRASELSLPPPEVAQTTPLNDNGSLVALRQARVAYTDQVIFDDLDLSIRPGEHWQVKGPNGSGKTCLLSLITGDHPQCYVNDIQVFGYKRGSGESIWEIKRHLGFVSTALHWDYRLSVSVRNVVISGFHDSIGVYSKASDQQIQLADAWLSLLGLKSRAGESFSKLSYGEQRVLLIARAMVKHPALLLLDEPCLGLDESNRQLVLALVKRIIEAGRTTLVYVTHHEEDHIPGVQHTLSLG